MVAPVVEEFSEESLLMSSLQERSSRPLDLVPERVECVKSTEKKTMIER